MTFYFFLSISKIADRLTVLVFLATSKQAGGGESLSLLPELSWNLKTDRRLANNEASEKVLRRAVASFPWTQKSRIFKTFLDSRLHGVTAKSIFQRSQIL